MLPVFGIPLVNTGMVAVAAAAAPAVTARGASMTARVVTVAAVHQQHCTKKHDP